MKEQLFLQQISLAAIVQDLLTMAMGVAVTKAPINLNEVIKGYLESLEYKKLMELYPTVGVGQVN